MDAPEIGPRAPAAEAGDGTDEPSRLSALRSPIIEDLLPNDRAVQGIVGSQRIESTRETRAGAAHCPDATTRWNPPL